MAGFYTNWREEQWIQWKASSRPIPESPRLKFDASGSCKGKTEMTDPRHGFPGRKPLAPATTTMPARPRRRPLARAVSSAVLALGVASSAQADDFPAVVRLSELDGTNGFKIDGEAAYDRSGTSVSAVGDLNVDGKDELVIGAPFADPNGDSSGRSYFLFGRSSGFTSPLQLSDMGTGGIKIDGEETFDAAGISVSNAGDINDDGVEDLIIGATTPLSGLLGKVYVVFGSPFGFVSPIQLSALDGANGFRIDGEAEGDRTGISVSAAGDVNGDGVGDLIIGAPRANRSYVVFGSTGGFTSPMKLASLDGTNGFKIDGGGAAVTSGRSVSAAGDVNGDGLDDLIIGADHSDANGVDRAGRSFVVFGSAAGFDSPLQLSSLDGSNGFMIDGVTRASYSGYSVSGAGDVNGDGVDDVMIGAPALSTIVCGPFLFCPGRSYVVFGSTRGFSSPLQLSSLDGTNGFRLNGEADGDQAGFSVSGAGDINGDGVDDVVIGAPWADPNGSGRSYVVFGTTRGFPPILELSDLDGTSGFKLDGEVFFDRSGFSVSDAGDINIDGVDDLIIGAPRADPNGDESGRTYVVFGRPVGLQLSELDGTNGFNIDGEAVGDQSGVSVSGVGDINGDNIDDLVIGAVAADPNGASSGRSYVVFGDNAGLVSPVQLSALDGIRGFKLDGETFYDFSANTVSGAGDINGDGIGDLIIGASQADPNGSDSGRSYVVFGNAFGFPSPIQLSALDGSNGFKIDGESEYDYSGRSVSTAGDVNGDGLDDLIISASGADPNGSESGRSYVVFGSDLGFPTPFQLSALDGANGFMLDGEAPGDFSGAAASAAGDINDDGVGDLIIGAQGADPNGSNSGRTYVVFGNEGGFTSPIQLSALNGVNGFKLDGEIGGDRSGSSVSSAGDVNGDGLDDLLIGARDADPNGSSSGRSYVVFGRSTGFSSPVPLASLDGTNGFILDGAAAGDQFGFSVRAAGDINDDGVDDLIVGARFADFRRSTNAGRSYVVFGRTDGFDSPIRLNFLDSASIFNLDGEASNDLAGSAVSAAGDINGDGVDDVIVGAPGSDPNGVSGAGRSYVVFGVGRPALELTPQILAFGEVEVGQASNLQTATITNIGAGDLALGVLDISGANSSDFALSNDNCSGQVIVPGSDCSFGVTLTPSATGSRTAQVDAPSNAPTSPDAVPLDGTGVQREVTLMPGNVDFGEVVVGQTSIARTVTIENTGSGNLSLGALALSGANPGDFALNNDTCSGQEIPPGAGCSFEVTLTPSATGARTAQVDIPSNAPTSPDSVPLTSTGVQPGVALMPASVDFGAVPVGQISSTQTVAIENTGTSDLIIGSLGLSGPDPGDFSLLNDNCSGNVIGPATDCTFDVVMIPSAPGTRSAQVDVPSNAPTSPDSVPVAGTGIQPAITLMPENVDFGAVAVDQTSAARTVTIENTGTGDLVLGTLALAGANSSDFVLLNDACSEQTLEPAADCTFELTLTPSAIGTRTARIDVPSNAPTSPDSVPLTGQGFALAELQVMPVRLDFGDQALDQPALPKRVDIENTGPGDLVIGTLTLEGLASDDYSLSMDACSGQTLAVDELCAIEVGFTPSAPGLRAARLRIPSNATGNPHFVDLVGSSGVLFADGFED